MECPPISRFPLMTNRMSFSCVDMHCVGTLGHAWRSPGSASLYLMYLRRSRNLCVVLSPIIDGQTLPIFATQRYVHQTQTQDMWYTQDLALSQSSLVLLFNIVQPRSGTRADLHGASFQGFTPCQPYRLVNKSITSLQKFTAYCSAMTFDLQIHSLPVHHL